MNGIERMTGRIAGDARTEAEAILAAARARADGVRANYADEARRLREEMLARGEHAAASGPGGPGGGGGGRPAGGYRAAAARRRRLTGAAERESRRAQLACRQALLDEAFARALEALCALPERDYVNLLAELAGRAAGSGREEIILCPADRLRCGDRVAARANELRRHAGQRGALTLSQETRDFHGGLILTDGSVEVNCTFASLLRRVRGRLSGQAAHVLFG